MTSSTARIISNEIDQALQNNGLAENSPLREELERTAKIGGGYQPEVAVRKGNSLRTLDERIREDPNFRDCFPATRTVSRNDEEAIRAEFDAIAKGTTVVV
jgi:hypothetical protein